MALTKVGWDREDTRSNAGFASSTASSQVTTRSREGIDEDKQLSIVVLPAWVPLARCSLQRGVGAGGVTGGDDPEVPIGSEPWS